MSFITRISVLTDSPESYYLFRILEDKVREDPNMSKYDTRQLYMYMLKYKEQTTLHFLLEALAEDTGEAQNSQPSWNTNVHAVIFNELGTELPLLGVLQKISKAD